MWVSVPVSGKEWYDISVSALGSQSWQHITAVSSSTRVSGTGASITPRRRNTLKGQFLCSQCSIYVTIRFDVFDIGMLYMSEAAIGARAHPSQGHGCLGRVWIVVCDCVMSSQPMIAKKAMSFYSIKEPKHVPLVD